MPRRRHRDRHAHAFPTPTPLTPAQALLAAHADVPGACVVSFSIDGTTLEPQLQVQDRLYDHLPIPRAAAACSQAGTPTRRRRPRHPPIPLHMPAVPRRGSTARGRSPAPPTSRRSTARGRRRMPWPPPRPRADPHVPQFTAKPEGESGWLRGNYAYIEDYRARCSTSRISPSICHLGRAERVHRRRALPARPRGDHHRRRRRPELAHDGLADQRAAAAHGDLLRDHGIGRPHAEPLHPAAVPHPRHASCGSQRQGPDGEPDRSRDRRGHDSASRPRWAASRK